MDSRLGVFLTVARMEQLTRASQHLNLAPSSVSQQITGLEQDLGAVLFIRTSRGMKLTASGRLLFTMAEEMEATWQKTVRTIQLYEHHSAEVRIAASHTVSELYLPRPLGRFRSESPHTRIHLSMTNSTNVVEQVLRGTVDIGIIEGAAPNSRVEKISLWRDSMGLIVSRQHPFVSHASIGLKELEHLEWILREPGSGTRRVFERALEDAGSSIGRLMILMELSSLRAITAMVANNVGVSVVSEAIVGSSEIKIPGVKLLPIRELSLTRTIEAVISPHSTSDTVKRLLSRLQEDVAIRQHQG